MAMPRPDSSGVAPERGAGGASNTNAPDHHVRYVPGLDDDAVIAPAVPIGLSRSDTTRSVPVTPIPRRRTGRAAAFKPIEDYEAFEDFEGRPGWHPGAEPGLDPSKPDGGHASMPTLSTPCRITVVDFSQESLSIHHHDNETLGDYLAHPQPEWAKCRWINVNGLSWDVIQTLGKYKNLHKLAIEDIMNTRNRTKAEWRVYLSAILRRHQADWTLRYPTHAFIVLTLQKLGRIEGDDSSDDDISDSDLDSDTLGRVSDQDDRSPIDRGIFLNKLRKLFRSKSDNEVVDMNDKTLSDHLEDQPPRTEVAEQYRTLQTYHAALSDPRTVFMEKHSALSSKGLAVACEQVSMFITQDNTIISFFELSADDVERPIIRRLQISDTIIRQSCDASMVGQGIIDAIIDLAIPVTSTYGDVIGDLELDVLTRPNLNHTKSLYIVISEINKMLSFINPIVTVINTLRDHKTDNTRDVTVHELQDPATGVIITPITDTYLGDVLDHCVMITETLNQHKNSADGLIGLIFNTISAYQNESMKQLTIATIIFLPLTFLTGYFGQNFQPFTVLEQDIGYFWKIALPVTAVVTLFMFRDVIYEYVKAILQRQYILRLRRKRARTRRRNRKRA
ncbi:hypothetical protein OQA88_9271 [Cercophora sp. LCS_1]